MKKMLWIVLMLTFSGVGVVFAQKSEPTVYVIKKGDTLWGLSSRFLNDPYYWPNLWARNPEIGNPHVITPGQRVLIYPDRIVVEGAKAQSPEAQKAEVVPSPPSPPEVVEARVFPVTGGEGFLLEKEFKPYGFVVATDQDRVVVGKNDPVYVDVGTARGAKAGDRFGIFRKDEPISHPVYHNILGDKIVPLGVLRLDELKETASRGIITDSYLEVSNGAFIMPYREKTREVALKGSDRQLSGYVLESLMGNKAIGVGEIVFLDLGRKQGIEVGNMLYVERDVVPQRTYSNHPIGELPKELLGAVVVVDAGANTSTALVVKSINAIYRGDQVELRKSK